MNLMSLNEFYGQTDMKAFEVAYGFDEPVSLNVKMDIQVVEMKNHPYIIDFDEPE